MSVQIDRTQKEKISPEFLARLNRLDSKQTVRIIVMLFASGKKTAKRRQSPDEREKPLKAILETTQQAVYDIETVLKEYGGQKLASKPNALGCLPIETTVPGVNALTSLQEVKAIMEDQPISLLR